MRSDARNGGFFVRQQPKVTWVLCSSVSFLPAGKSASGVWLSKRKGDSQTKVNPHGNQATKTSWGKYFLVFWGAMSNFANC